MGVCEERTHGRKDPLGQVMGHFINLSHIAVLFLELGLDLSLGTDKSYSVDVCHDGGLDNLSVDFPNKEVRQGVAILGVFLDQLRHNGSHFGVHVLGLVKRRQVDLSSSVNISS